MQEFYICDPSKRTDCRRQECYINGGQCCLTKNREYKYDGLDEKLVEVIDKYILHGSPKLPFIIRRLISQKEQRL